MQFGLLFISNVIVDYIYIYAYEINDYFSGVLDCILD